MLRELRSNCAEAPDATYAAAVELHTGMGVIKDRATGTLKLPTAATDSGIFVVQKMPIPTGVNTAYENLSDYTDEFNTVAEGERCVAYKYLVDDVFATDQYATALSTPGYVKVGTDGKWAAVSSGTSKFYFTGLIKDGLYHTLARIEVVD